MKTERFVIIAITILTIALSFAFLSYTAVGLSSTGTTFDANVSIANVQNLFGLEFELGYNTACLDLIKATPRPPWGQYLILKNYINDAEGTYRLSMVGIAPTPPFDGDTVLATLTFRRTDIGEDNIYLTETSLADFDVEPIPHIAEGCGIYAISVHDVAVTHIIGIPRSAVQGAPINVEVTVKNQGNFPETFDVTVYADRDKTVIGDEIIVGKHTESDLPAKTREVIHFTWDTTGAPYGAYWLSAEASVVPDETDVNDNFLKAAEWIGGIYPPKEVRDRTDLMVKITSMLIVVSLIFTGTVELKKNWFP